MPDNHNEELDTYTIPPNFIEGGTLFGGTLKLRNSLEAGAFLLAVGLPVLRLPLSLTTRVIFAEPIADIYIKEMNINPVCFWHIVMRMKISL